MAILPLTVERFLRELQETLPPERDARVHTELHKELVFGPGFAQTEITEASPRIRVVVRSFPDDIIREGFTSYEAVATLSLDAGGHVYRVDIDDSKPYWLIAAVVAVRDRVRGGVE